MEIPIWLQVASFTIMLFVTLLGTLLGFMYYLFTSMEKRIDLKLDLMTLELHRVANDIEQDRRDKANLYNFVLSNAKK